MPMMPMTAPMVPMVGQMKPNQKWPFWIHPAIPPTPQNYVINVFDSFGGLYPADTLYPYDWLFPNNSNVSFSESLSVSTAYTRDSSDGISEGITINSAVIRSASLARNLADTLALAGSISHSATMVRSLSDGISISTVGTRSLSAGRIVNESLGSSVPKTFSNLGFFSHWRLNEASSPYVDRINAINLTGHGTLTQQVAGGTADGDTALGFDGSTGYADSPGNFSTMSPPFTWTFLVWIDPTLDNADHYIMSNGISGTFLGFYVRISSGQIGVSAGNGTGFPSITMPSALTKGAWHLVSVAVNTNGSTVTVFVDGAVGIQNVNSPGVWTPGVGSGLQLGRLINNTGYFKGRIDEVGIGLFEMSLTQHQQLYANINGSVDFATRSAASSRNTNDAITLSELVTRAYAGARLIIDSLTLSESLSHSAGASRTLLDVLSLSSAVTYSATLTRLISEALPLSENLTRSTTATRTLVDSITINSAVTHLTGLFRTQNETLNLGETLTRSGNLNRSLIASLSLSDIVTRSSVLTRSLADSLHFVDSTSFLSGSHIVNLVDAMMPGDAITHNESMTRNRTELIALNDVVQRTYTGFRFVTQPLGFGDVITRSQTTSRHLNEALSFIDTLGHHEGTFRILGDQLRLTDNLALQVSYSSVIFDPLNLTDSLIVVHGMNRNLIEAIQFSEELAIIYVSHHGKIVGPTHPYGRVLGRRAKVDVGANHLQEGVFGRKAKFGVGTRGVGKVGKKV